MTKRVAATMLAIALATGARADSVEDFYRGRQINWILSAGAGGGYSSYAQAFAPFWSAHIPGKPNFVIQNMPGAGGIRAMQYLFANAPKDGATLGLVHSSVPFAPLFDLPGSKFDSRQFNWIGSLNSESELCVAWHTSPIKTWRDMLTNEFVVGGTGGGSQMETLPEAVNRLFGTHIKVISGYTSGSEVYLAMERGEVQGRCSVGASSINATRPTWLSKKLVTVPVQISLRRDPLFPDSPTLLELATDERTKQILGVLLSYEEMERPVLAPPGVPGERVTALRESFHNAMVDPGFIAEAKRLNIDISELGGERIAQILAESYALPRDVMKAAKDALSMTADGAFEMNARACFALHISACVCASTAARADAIEDFYRGKQITMILSAGAGGCYATYMQAFAPFLTKYIPGHPAVVLQNMPGAGGIRAMMFLNAAAPKDGTTLGFVHSSVPFAPLYGIKGANFDSRKMNWIGSLNTSTAICVSWTASGITTWKDLFDKGYIVGGTGAGSQMETMPAMINKLFGAHIKVISGYTGGADVYLAMERGEVHGRCGGLVSSIRSTRPNWFPQHKVSVPIVVAMQRSPLFSDTPAIAEFAKDDKTRRVLKLILAPLSMDRPMLAPPGVPADRVMALRQAFHAAMNDPAFIADAKRIDIEINEASGEAVQSVLDEAFQMPPGIVRAANAAMSLTGASTE